MNNLLIKKRAKMDILFSFSDIQKIKMHTFKRFWDTMECTEKLRDLSEGAREDMGRMERYWDITEGARDIMGNKEGDWAMTGFLGLIMRRIAM
jgi:hypothetical protein